MQWPTDQVVVKCKFFVENDQNQYIVKAWNVIYIIRGT